MADTATWKKHVGAWRASGADKLDEDTRGRILHHVVREVTLAHEAHRPHLVATLRRAPRFTDLSLHGLRFACNSQTNRWLEY